MAQVEAEVPVQEPVQVQAVITHLVGQVKWFNNKAGFGFITVSDEGDYQGKDIFAHYSTLGVTASQYKYLVQGEYVEFDLVNSKTGTHEFQAVGITGIKGGPLMCETREKAKTQRPSSAPSTVRRQPSAPADDGKGKFVTVKRGRPKKA